MNIPGYTVPTLIGSPKEWNPSLRLLVTTTQSTMWVGSEAPVWQMWRLILSTQPGDSDHVTKLPRMGATFPAMLQQEVTFSLMENNSLPTRMAWKWCIWCDGSGPAPRRLRSRRRRWGVSTMKPRLSAWPSPWQWWTYIASTAPLGTAESVVEEQLVRCCLIWPLRSRWTISALGTIFWWVLTYWVMRISPECRPLWKNKLAYLCRISIPAIGISGMGTIGRLIFASLPCHGL